MKRCLRRGSLHGRRSSSTKSPIYWWLLTSRRWLTGLPINVYVIEHADGLVVFDTGQDRASVTDPEYYPGGPLGVIYLRLARFDIPADQTLTRQLRALGYDATDVDMALISHLHQDHIGGLSELPNAQIVLTEAEKATMNGLSPEANGILRSHLDFPASRWRTIEFEEMAGIPAFDRGFDLFGDGSLVLVSTPGHTPGSMSLLVRASNATPSLLVGDVTYDADAMVEDGVIPGVGDRAALAATTRLIQSLHSAVPNLQILAAHDPATFDMPPLTAPANDRRHQESPSLPDTQNALRISSPRAGGHRRRGFMRTSSRTAAATTLAQPLDPT